MSNLLRVLHPSASLILLLAALLLPACNKTDDSPTGGSEAGWSVAGRTYLIGAVEPTAGVVVKCAGVSAVSGSDGSFELRGIPGGSQTITAEKADCEPYSQSLTIRSNATQYIYLKQKSGTVWGIVSHAFDGPIEGARVSLRTYVDYTDITGRYEFSNVPRIGDTLVVTHPAYLDVRTALVIDTQEKRIDINLKKDEVIDSRVTLDTYVDEVYSTYVLGYSQQLLLGIAGIDSLGRYRFSRRHILLNFSFPEILRNDSVSLLDASLQLCSDGSYPSAAIQTFSVESPWSIATTFNSQPSVGALLYSGTVGDGSGAKYWPVLATEGFRQLFVRWKERKPFYGVMVQGGLVTPRGFYSSRSTKNTPRVSFKIRY